MPVDRFRKMADKLRYDAEHKLRPRDTHTAKKLGQARSAERDGLHYQRAAKLIDAYCDGLEASTLPASLTRGFKPRKDDFLNSVAFVSKNVQNGYHSYIVDGDEYRDASEQAVALRELVAKSKTPEEREAEAEQQRRIAVARKIDALRGCDIPGFFPTPAPVIEMMLAEADIEDHHRVLEPSAGLGDIVDAIKADGFSGFLDAIEVNSSLCAILGAKGHHHQRFDFLEWKGTKYDRVLMNPPFERKQAVKHIQHAYGLLRPGGRVVAILPTNHVDDLGFESINLYEVPPNAFNVSGAFRRTGVSVAMVVIDKPLVDEDTATRSQRELFA